MENLHDKRKVYEKSQLLESEIKENPIEMFRDWFLDAEESPSVSEANAMAISTVEGRGLYLHLLVNLFDSYYEFVKEVVYLHQRPKG